MDKLSLRSLLAVARARTAFSHIYYFDQTENARSYADLFRRLRLLRAAPEYVFFRLGDLKDERGGALFYKILEDVTSTCAKIEKGELTASQALRAAARRFDREKLFLFFKKIIATEINPTFISVRAVEWHSRVNGMAGTDKTFFTAKSHWRRYLSDYAREQNVGLKSYGLFGRSTYFRAKLSGIAGSLVRGVIKRGITAKALSAVKPQRTDGKIPTKTEIKTVATPIIGAVFTGRTVTFDPKKRSEFFWFLDSDLPPEQILVYLQQAHTKVTAEMVERLADRKINLTALVSSGGVAGAPVWRYRIKIVDYLRLVMPAVVRLWRQPKRFFYLAALSYFITKYLYWYNFIKSHNIKININPMDFIEANIPMQQAVADNNGVSVTYHWSNINLTSIFISNCADVLFSFGPAYKTIFDKNQSVIDSIVYCGYITDHSFKEVKEDARELRERLRGAGAEFILCFFDENSDEGKTSVVTHKKTTDTYRYFLERLMEDETLGLIFKPGYPKTIYERTSPISELITKAKATGRCVFIDKGSYVSEKYPSEAAQAADLSVGLLLSGTVALESYLSGIPTVFLDLEKLYSNPIYEWGKGKVVFDTMDGLFSAIARYRQDPAAVPGFGDLSKWAEGKDPFRDGKASLRIGQYLNWLLEKFNEDRTRNEAIAYANANYQREWGIGPDSVNSSRT